MRTAKKLILLVVLICVVSAQLCCVDVPLLADPRAVPGIDNPEKATVYQRIIWSPVWYIRGRVAYPDVKMVNGGAEG